MNRPLSILFLLALPLSLSRCGLPGNDPEPLSSGTFEKALVILQTQAHAGSAEARANCVEALQASPDPRAMDIIEQGLHDGEWVVRFAAAMAAGQRKADGVRPVLNTLVRTQEYEADIFGLNTARQPDGEAEADMLVGEYRKLDPTPLEEFLFFDHPSGRTRIYAAMRWKAENQCAGDAANPCGR